jgi:hypothetical protein
MGNVGNRRPRRANSSATRAGGFVTIHWDQVLKALRRPTCRSGFGLIGGGLTGFAWPYFPQFQGSTLFAVMFTYGIIRVAALLGSRFDRRQDGIPAIDRRIKGPGPGQDRGRGKLGSGDRGPGLAATSLASSCPGGDELGAGDPAPRSAALGVPSADADLVDVHDCKRAGSAAVSARNAPRSSRGSTPSPT